MAEAQNKDIQLECLQEALHLDVNLQDAIEQDKLRRLSQTNSPYNRIVKQLLKQHLEQPSIHNGWIIVEE